MNFLMNHCQETKCYVSVTNFDFDNVTPLLVTISVLVKVTEASVTDKPQSLNSS